jgi:hypothetical protein
MDARGGGRPGLREFLRDASSPTRSDEGGVDGNTKRRKPEGPKIPGLQ